MNYKCFTNQTIEILLENSAERISVNSKKNRYSVLTFKKSDGKTYFRFSSSRSGRYVFSDGSKKKHISIAKYKGSNSLYRLGPVIKENNKLWHTDGSDFFMLSDTLWFGLTNRMSFDEFKKHIDLRRKQGFNAIQLVVGNAPEVDINSRQTANEGGVPFPDNKINIKYFDYVDRRIEYIVEKGLIPVIFGSWGHHIDILGKRTIKNLWREIVARYSSYPVIFCLTGEVEVHLDNYSNFFAKEEPVKKYAKKIVYALPYPISSKIVGLRRRFVNTAKISDSPLLKHRITKWNDVGSFIKSINTYKRLITAHPQGNIRVSKLLGNPSYLDVDAIQVGHSMERYEFLLKSLRASTKPIFNLETTYEGITGKFYNRYQRVAFWYTLLSGASGFAYGAHGVWQVSKDDNFMHHWGNSRYSKAIKYSSPKIIGKSLKLFMRRFRVNRLTPLAFNNIDLFPTVSAKIGSRTITYIPRVSEKFVKQNNSRLINPETLRHASIKKQLRKDLLIIK